MFLDEIQKVGKFEEVVNSLRASIENISIFITGSNSKLLSNDYQPFYPEGMYYSIFIH